MKCQRLRSRPDAWSRATGICAGDLQEELGILLLKAIAFVATVPRQEDAGNDAVATLIRPDGSRKLIPDLTFFVQLKSKSTKSVSYTRRLTKWRGSAPSKSRCSSDGFI